MSEMDRLVAYENTERDIARSIAILHHVVPPMSDKIEPALSAEEWTGVLRVLAENPLEMREAPGVGPYQRRDLSGTGYYEEIGPNPTENARFIAINNAALPDDDPRKITRERVELLREDLDEIDYEFSGADKPHPIVARLRAHFDALASYLPPEGT